jgi:ParB-like chromosome segregation protein Spo0J
MATAAVEFAQTSGTMPISLVSSASTVKLPTTLKQVGVRRDYQMINPRQIEIEEGLNPRNYNLAENRAHLDELKLSIAEIGLIQPLIVRLNRETGKAILLDGECRWRAIMELIAEGHPLLSDADVPCFPAPTGSNDEASRLLTAITANTGKPLSKWELGGAFQKLYNLGLSPEKIMARTGYADRFIREAMELADAPDEIKQLLSSQAVTPSLALAELRANGAAAVETLKAAANAAQSSGKKGPAKRAKSKTLPPAKPRTENEPAPAAPTANGKAKQTPKSQAALCPEVMAALVELMSDVALSDLNDDKLTRVSVDKELLLKLASFMVTEEEAKHIQAGDVAF